MLDYAYVITQVLLSIAFLCAVYRVFAGPSVLDRVISVDVMLIVVASLLFADMAVNNHQDNILFALGTAVIGFLGAVAIARYVAVRTPEEMQDASREDANAHAIGNPSAVEPEVASGHTGENTVVEGQSPTREDHDGSAEGSSGDTAKEAEEEEEDQDESTSWFTALARSRHVSRAEADTPEGTSDDTSPHGEEQR